MRGVQGGCLVCKVGALERAHNNVLHSGVKNLELLSRDFLSPGVRVEACARPQSPERRKFFPRLQGMMQLDRRRL